MKGVSEEKELKLDAILCDGHIEVGDAIEFEDDDEVDVEDTV